MVERSGAPEDQAPEWFYRNLETVTGSFAEPLKDRELCLMVHVSDSRGCAALRAAAEIKRLRAEKAALEERLAGLRDAAFPDLISPHTDLGIPAEAVTNVSYGGGRDDQR
jgi:hypothetical protein